MVNIVRKRRIMEMIRRRVIAFLFWEDCRPQTSAKCDPRRIEVWTLSQGSVPLFRRRPAAPPVWGDVL
jgi:hypothetical protein